MPPTEMWTMHFGGFVLLMYASPLLDGTAAMPCYMGQEPDPSSGRYRWVIPVKNPCNCQRVHMGSVNTHAPSRTFNVTYYDTLLTSSDPVDIGQFLNCTASCKAYVSSGRSHGNGYYKIQPQCAGKQELTVYCDQTSNGGGWMRFYQKTDQNTCSGYDFTWTAELIRCMGIDTEITGFAVSDSITTVDTDNSWILENSRWLFDSFVKCANSRCDESESLDGQGAGVIANLANCKTPSGAGWSQGYQDGYAKISGKLNTNGGWTRMYRGCDNYVHIGNSTSFRIGGAISHTGEFIHTACNDYDKHPENKVTSRWDWDNVRAIWIMIN